MARITNTVRESCIQCSAARKFHLECYHLSLPLKVSPLLSILNIVILKFLNFFIYLLGGGSLFLVFSFQYGQNTYDMFQYQGKLTRAKQRKLSTLFNLFFFFFFNQRRQFYGKGSKLKIEEPKAFQV